MKKLVWCSAHAPTNEQKEELSLIGDLIMLKDLNPELQGLINNCPSDRIALLGMANQLSDIDGCLVQPGGSPLFLYILGSVIQGARNKNSVLFAHSERVSADVPQSDGTVIKTSVFKHLGFI